MPTDHVEKMQFHEMKVRRYRREAEKAKRTGDFKTYELFMHKAIAHQIRAQQHARS